MKVSRALSRIRYMLDAQWGESGAESPPKWGVVHGEVSRPLWGLSSRQRDHVLGRGRASFPEATHLLTSFRLLEHAVLITEKVFPLCCSTPWRHPSNFHCLSRFCPPARPASRPAPPWNLPQEPKNLSFAGVPQMQNQCAVLPFVPLCCYLKVGFWRKHRCFMGLLSLAKSLTSYGQEPSFEFPCILPGSQA